jgi:hypothetical protein
MALLADWIHIWTYSSSVSNLPLAGWYIATFIHREAREANQDSPVMDSYPANVLETVETANRYLNRSSIEA